MRNAVITRGARIRVAWYIAIGCAIIFGAGFYLTGEVLKAGLIAGAIWVILSGFWFLLIQIDSDTPVRAFVMKNLKYIAATTAIMQLLLVLLRLLKNWV